VVSQVPTIFSTMHHYWDLKNRSFEWIGVWVGGYLKKYVCRRLFLRTGSVPMLWNICILTYLCAYSMEQSFLRS
jgi:hypothetical protein